MRKAYIAGPMTGKPFYNFPAFFRAEGILQTLGYDTVNPAQVDVDLWVRRGMGPFGYELLRGEPMSDYGTRKATVRRDLNLISRLDETDVMVVLPGWEESTGARAETAVAAWLGIRVVTLQDAVKEGNVAETAEGSTGEEADADHDGGA